MDTEKKQTAVTLLFQEFKALSEVMRKAGDEQSANLIDFLCEREEVAKQMEKEQIVKANRDGVDMVIAEVTYVTGEQYYNETYGGDNE
jgi:Mor family transcriptional regulator